MQIPILFPFSDLESVNGIIVNILNQMFIAVVGISAVISIEIVTCILKNSVYTIAAIICHSIDRFFNIFTCFEQSEQLFNRTVHNH